MSATLMLILRLAIAVALVAFLAWAFYLLWREMRNQSSLLAIRQVPRLTLRRSLPGDEEIRHFVHSPVILGRDSGCDFPVDDRTVSIRHARLSFHHNQWWLEDLDSTNGTQINSLPVDEAVVLTTGDSLKCGQVEFSLVIARGDENFPGADEAGDPATQ